MSAKLITEYRPHGVDVSSGVETDGVKDMAKIRSIRRKGEADMATNDA